MPLRTINRRFYIIGVFLLIGSCLIYIVDKTIKQGELEKRKRLLQAEGIYASQQFLKGIDKFSVLVSGIQSYVQVHPSVPSKQEMYRYLKNQANSLEVKNTIVVSFLDTNHVFKYSISPSSLSPNNLEGQMVSSFRNGDEIDRLEFLLEKDGLHLFPPLNLVEGYVGIPLNFRVTKKGIVQGYMACLIDFKQIINEVYDRPTSKDIVYHFSTNQDVSFSREGVYDGSTIYNSKKDEEWYENYNLPDRAYTTHTVSRYNNDFNIGFALKQPYKRGAYITLSLISWFFALAVSLLFFLLYWRLQIKEHRLLEDKNRDLRNANESLKHFTHASSHDLKEPLRTIGSFSALLKRNYYEKLDNSAKEYLDYIVSSVQKMNILLDDLLKYSSVISNFHLGKENVNINVLVQKVIEDLGPTINEKNTKIAIGSLPTVIANPSLLYQLFQSLISNAINFNDKASPEVSIDFIEDQNTYLVKDNGVGIDPAFHENIFVAFKRLSNDIRSSGIGLTICKKIVEHHNGTIWVESELGKGTSFYFSLSSSI